MPPPPRLFLLHNLSLKKGHLKPFHAINVKEILISLKLDYNNTSKIE